jgi:hypothetical protein
MLHELIDRDDPKCLYCHSGIVYELKSEWLPATPLKIDVELISCNKCKEVFKIHSIQGADGHTEYNGMTFTCKGYHVFFNYIESYFDISDEKGKHIVAIPSFTVDFSDKSKLYEKLKTYLIFS